MAGAPLGNQNAAKAKQWAAAIERALERRGDPSIVPDHPIERSPRAKALDELADLFIAKSSEPGLGFFKEFGDRMDGKPSQQIDLGNAGGEPFSAKIIREIINA